MTGRHRPSGAVLRSWLVDAGLVLVALALVFVTTLIALATLTAGAEGGTRRELVIEPGTAARIAAGENPELVPAAWTLYDGDTLVLHNQDEVTHQLADWIVAPGATREIVLSADAAPSSLLCTLHPAGKVTLEVLPTSADPRLAVAPTLLVGSGLGAAAVFVRRMLRLVSP